jgi:glycosyltransferase involved in cell wall biosynthesis
MSNSETPGKTTFMQGDNMPDKQPKLSVIVIVYDMPKQAMNTLHSLSSDYQLAVDADDYEIIVIENHSSNNLDEKEVTGLNGNFRYLLRKEPRPTPIYAVNHGISIARGENICLMIDGARLLTPRVIRYTLDAFIINPDAIVAIPGYHIGEKDQKFNSINLHNEASEEKLLEDINWRNQGYSIFDVSCFSGANSHGYFHPLLESNCLSCSKTSLLAYGGANEMFQSPGGGAVNLDLYRGLCLDPDKQLFVTPGEGSFHQYHGGVTTMQRDDLDELLLQFREEYNTVRGEDYQAARREPTIIGAITKPALKYLALSVEGAENRFTRFTTQQKSPWPDDTPNHNGSL